MKSVNDALFELAKSYNAKKDHKQSILEIYPIWLKLCPGNKSVLMWLADNTLCHTGDARLQLHYIDEFLKTANGCQEEILKYRMKRTVLYVQHCMYEDVKDYLTNLQCFNALCHEFLLTDKRQFPVSYYFVPMLAQTDLACKILYKIRPVRTAEVQKQPLSRKVGFMWLPIKSDPSFQCLKFFIAALAKTEDVTIFFDEKSVLSSMTISDQKLLERVKIKNCAELSDQEIAALVKSENIGILINIYWNFRRGFGVFEEIAAIITINFQGFASPICAPEVFTYSISDIYLSRKVKIELTRREKFIIMPIYHQINFPEWRQPPKVIRVHDQFILGYMPRTAKCSPSHVDVILRFLESTEETQIYLFCSNKNIKQVTESLLLLGLLPKYLTRVFVIYEPHREKYLRRLGEVSMFLDSFGHWSMHSTALEVLWNWVPLITMKSDTLFSHCEAILQSLDLDELVFDQVKELVEALVRFSKKESSDYALICHKLITNCERNGMFKMDTRISHFTKAISSILKKDNSTNEDILI